MSYVVNVGYDQAEVRYYVLSSDIGGLHVEASSFEEFVETARDLASDLIDNHTPGTSISFRRELELA